MEMKESTNTNNLLFYICDFWGVPFTDVTSCKSLEYVSASLLMTSICSIVVWTASKCCLPQGTQADQNCQQDIKKHYIMQLSDIHNITLTTPRPIHKTYIKRGMIKKQKSLLRFIGHSIIECEINKQIKTVELKYVITITY